VQGEHHLLASLIGLPALVSLIISKKKGGGGVKILALTEACRNMPETYIVFQCCTTEGNAKIN